jgi:hypothetical protein
MKLTKFNKDEIKHGPWSKEEDLKLMVGVKLFGQKYALLANMFNRNKPNDYVEGVPYMRTEM